MSAPKAGLPNPATRMPAQWLAEALRLNPVTACLDANGQPDGNFRTCPVRLSWINLFEPEKPKRQNDGTMSAGGKFGTDLLFPVGADLSLLQNVAIQLAYQKKPEAYVNGQFYGIHLPFRDQAEKCMKAEGYMPGGIFFAVKSKFQPQVLMPGATGADGRVQWQVVTDPKKVYPGVWAICTINPFWFDQGVKKGVSFGLQNVCIISDDQQFGGGGGRDAQRDFAGVQLAPNTDFSTMMASAPLAPGAVAPGGPMSVMPPAQPIAPQYRPQAAPLPVPGLPVAPAAPSKDDDLAALGL